MNKEIIIEVCANSLESAIIAQQEGANRIELCQSLNEGGLTPSAGTLKKVKEHLSIKVNVLIRPRGGDFCYSNSELQEMREDLLFIKKMGFNGVVLGILDQEGNIDKKVCADLMKIARPMSVTFHRAFDVCKNSIQALDDLIDLGVDRLLTSGQQNKAIDGIPLIKKLLDQAGNKLVVMAGSGIDSENIQQIIKETGIKECHVSASNRINSIMKFRRKGIAMGGVKSYPEFEKRQTDPSKLKAIIKAVKA